MTFHSVVAVPHQTVHAEMHFFCQLAQSGRRLMVSTDSTCARAQGVIALPLLFPKSTAPIHPVPPDVPRIGATVGRDRCCAVRLSQAIIWNQFVAEFPMNFSLLARASADSTRRRPNVICVTEGSNDQPAAARFLNRGVAAHTNQRAENSTHGNLRRP